MTTSDAFIAVWPVRDPDRPLPDLIKEATPDLGRLLAQAHAALTAPPRWGTRPGHNIPGSGGADTVLVCIAPAIPTTGRTRP